MSSATRWLRQAVVIAQLDDEPLLLAQMPQRLPQGEPFQQLFLHAVRAEDVFKGKALLASLPLDRFGGAGGRLGAGDLLRR